MKPRLVVQALLARVFVPGLLGLNAGALQAQPDLPKAVGLRMEYSLAGSPREKPDAAPPTARLSSAPAYGEAIQCRELASQDTRTLTLLDVVGHVMCKTPLLNQAVLLVDEQQAGVDLAKSAYRPRLFANAELANNRIPSSNSGSASLSSSATGSLGLSWVLFDAGARDATLEQSRQQLGSAKAGQQAAVINAINEAMRLYVEAATAWARLDALRETESVARQSLQVAEAKHQAQVASLSEKLQAMTALAQATLDRVRAEGVWETSRGLLAVAMGFPVHAALVLAPIDTAFPAIEQGVPVMNWIEVAKASHPRLTGARADVMALKARLDSIRAEGKGSVSLSLGAGSTRDLATPGSRFEQSLSGYVIASVPIFNHAEQQAREGQVVAQIASRESAITQVERDIEAELWRNAKLLETETQNLEAAQTLLQAATQNYQIIFGRYKAGVGSILELIGAQASLSTARAQMTQARLGNVYARLRLEVASGHLLFSQ